MASTSIFGNAIEGEGDGIIQSSPFPLPEDTSSLPSSPVELPELSAGHLSNPFHDISPSSPSTAGIDSASSEYWPRWTASDGKYKRRVRGERQLLAALERLENDDLSAHLYNTHTIKRNALDPEAKTGDRTHLVQNHGKRKWLDSASWAPRKRWSAWPLPPDAVPAEGEAWWGRPSAPTAAFKANTLNRSTLTEELEGCLLAGCARQAREEFALSQASEVEVDAANSGRRAGMVDKTLHTVEIGEYSSPETPALSNSSREHSVVEKGESSRPESLSSLGPSAEADADTKADASLRKKVGESGDGFAPVPCADDDELERHLEPCARQILAGLDRLLLALHRSRLHHAGQERVGSRAHAQSRSRSRTREHEHDLSPPDHSFTSSASRSASPSSERLQDPLRRLHLRDWSEILGLAAAVGWEDRVIEQSARRCSGLFGEGMRLHRLDHKPTSSENYLLHASSDEALTEPRSLQSRDIPQGWLCPEKDCKHSQPAWAYKRRHRWLTHLKKKHGRDYAGPQRVLDSSGEVRVVEGEDDFTCPDPSCKRHTWSFNSRWRLNEHLKRTHGTVNASTALRQPSTSVERSTEGSVSNESRKHNRCLHGRVHPDAFMQPIMLPARA